MEGKSSSSNQNQSKIIEKRIRWTKQRAEESLNKNEHSGFLDEFLKMYEYSIKLERLYKLAKEKAPEVLPKLEKLVKETSIDSFYIQLFSAIGDYILIYIPYTEHDNTYKQKIQNLEKGLELLLKINVRNKLSKLYWDVYSGKSLSLVNSYLKQIGNSLEDYNGQGLNWKTKEYVPENVAYNYLYSHIKCLLSNPDEYMQLMKLDNLETFIRELCELTPG
ncbi:MAG: hypothetical protein RXQ68_03175 [Candidatus Nanopusillus sp.]